MRISYEMDEGAGARARLGLIVLNVDETIEQEMRRFIDIDGVALHCTRVESGAELNERSIAAMAARIPDAAECCRPIRGWTSSPMHARPVPPSSVRRGWPN